MWYVMTMITRRCPWNAHSDWIFVLAVLVLLMEVHVVSCFFDVIIALSVFVVVVLLWPHSSSSSSRSVIVMQDLQMVSLVMMMLLLLLYHTPAQMMSW